MSGVVLTCDWIDEGDEDVILPFWAPGRGLVDGCLDAGMRGVERYRHVDHRVGEFDGEVGVGDRGRGGRSQALQLLGSGFGWRSPECGVRAERQPGVGEGESVAEELHGGVHPVCHGGDECECGARGRLELGERVVAVVALRQRAAQPRLDVFQRRRGERGVRALHVVHRQVQQLRAPRRQGGQVHVVRGGSDPDSQRVRVRHRRPRPFRGHGGHPLHQAQRGRILPAPVALKGAQARRWVPCGGTHPPNDHIVRLNKKRKQQPE